MRIVDRDREQLEEENRLEGKRKKLVEGLIIAVAATGFFFLANLMNGKVSAFQEPYLVMLGNVEVRPGRTSIQDLADEGYGFSDIGGRKAVQNGEDISFVYSELYDLSAKADGNTVYTSIILVKDGQCAALVSAVNRKSTEVPLAECKVGSVCICGDYYEAELTSLEGVAFDELNVEALTEVLGEPESESESGDSYKWKRGGCYLVVEYKEDGTLDNFRSECSKFYGRK